MMKSTLKKIVVVVLAVALASMVLAACGGGNGGNGGNGGGGEQPAGDSGYTANNTKFVLGASGPLTGGAAIYGIAVQNSAQMAVDEINAAGGINGVEIEFRMLDDMHDATKVKTNFSSLYEGGMQVSLGCVTSAPGQEWTNLSHETPVFFITPSASNDDIPKYDNGYQMCFADGNQGLYAAGYVNDNYAGQTIGIFYKSDDNYSSGIYDTFMANLDPSIQVVETTFTGDASTFDSQIQQLKDCKFIFMPIYYTPASQFMIQAKGTIADDAIYFGCDGFDGIDSGIEGFDITTIPQEVSMLSHFDSKATGGAEKDYIDKYVAAYGADTLNQFGASAYDCVYAIAKAMTENADKVSVTMSAEELNEVLKAAFQEMTFTGVTGGGQPITWDENGYVNKSAVKYTIKEANK